MRRVVVKSLIQNACIILQFFLSVSLVAADCTDQFRDCAKQQCEVGDLTASYQTAQSLLSCMQKEIANLPAQNQTDLLNELKTAQAAAQKAYLKINLSLILIKIVHHHQRSKRAW